MIMTIIGITGLVVNAMYGVTPRARERRPLIGRPG